MQFAYGGRGTAINSARIDRALSILSYLAQHQEGCTLKRLCEDLEMPMSSAHDLMQALVEIHAVRTIGGRTYALGSRSVTLALSIVDSVDLRQVSRPYLTELCEEVNENTYLALRMGGSVVYADRYEAGQTLSVVMKLGGPRPLHASSVGKLLTAFNADLEARVMNAGQLEEFTPYTLTAREGLRQEFELIRSRGYSVSDGESVEGIVGLSTPIVDAAGTAVAAVHISAPRGRLGPTRIPVVVAAMQQAGAQISRDLGAVGDAIKVLSVEQVRHQESTPANGTSRRQHS